MKVLRVNLLRLESSDWVGGELSHLLVPYSRRHVRCPDVDVDVLDLERDIGTADSPLRSKSPLLCG